VVAWNQGHIFIRQVRVMFAFDLNGWMVNAMLLAIIFNVMQHKVRLVCCCDDMRSQHDNTWLQGPHMQIVNRVNACKLQVAHVKHRLIVAMCVALAVQAQ